MNFAPRQIRLLLIWCALAVVQVIQVRGDDGFVVKLIDGSQRRGDLVGWEQSGLKLNAGGEIVELETAQLLRISRPGDAQNSATSPTFLQLSDGTRLAHEAYEVRAGQATIATALAPEPFSISTALIEWVSLMPNAPELSDAELQGDALVIYNKKRDSFDQLDGILGDISAEKVQFEWDGETLPVNRNKVGAVGYFHAKRESVTDPVCWLKLADGTRLPIAKLLRTGSTIQATTISDVDFSIPLDMVRVADYSHDKLIYLSDLKPTYQQWSPRIDLPSSAQLIKQHGMPRRDQSFTGSTLALVWPHPKTGILGGERKNFEKGLALRSRTVMRYRVPKGMTRFIAIAGIDPETSAEGHITLELFADKRLLWEGEIIGGAEPTEINVELGTARELRIVVDFGENLDYGDRLHLVEARISK